MILSWQENHYSRKRNAEKCMLEATSQNFEALIQENLQANNTHCKSSSKQNGLCITRLLYND